MSDGLARYGKTDIRRKRHMGYREREPDRRMVTRYLGLGIKCCGARLTDSGGHGGPISEWPVCAYYGGFATPQASEARNIRHCLSSAGRDYRVMTGMFQHWTNGRNQLPVRGI